MMVARAVPTRFMLLDELIAHGCLPRYGSEAGFVHPVTGGAQAAAAAYPVQRSLTEYLSRAHRAAGGP